MNANDEMSEAVFRASASDEGVRRRTIVKGAAWSIPVIAAAAAVPLLRQRLRLALRVALSG